MWYSLVTCISFWLLGGIDRCLSQQIPQIVADESPVITKPLHVLRGHNNFISSIAFSADQSAVAANSDDGNIRIWSATTGKSLFHRKENGLSTLALSPDGLTLGVCYSISSHYRIQAWSRNNVKPKWDYDHPERDSQGTGPLFGISRDGKLLAFCIRRESVLRLLDMETGKSRGRINVDGLINAFTFASTKDSVAIAYTSKDSGQQSENIVGVWDLKECERIQFISKGRSKSLHTGLKFSPDDKSLIEILNNRKVALVDAKTGGTQRAYYESDFNFEDVAGQHKNKLLVLQWLEGGGLAVWQVGNQKRQVRIPSGTEHFMSKALFSNNGSMVATAMNDGTILLWSIQP